MEWRERERETNFKGLQKPFCVEHPRSGRGAELHEEDYNKESGTVKFASEREPSSRMERVSQRS